MLCYCALLATVNLEEISMPFIFHYVQTPLFHPLLALLTPMMQVAEFCYPICTGKITLYAPLLVHPSVCEMTSIGRKTENSDNGWKYWAPSILYLYHRSGLSSSKHTRNWRPGPGHRPQSSLHILFRLALN
jgi:hypothetical protein